MKNIYIKKILFFGILFVVFQPHLSVAQDNFDRNIINQQDWIARQMQNKIEDDRRNKDLENFKKLPKSLFKNNQEKQIIIPKINIPVILFVIKLDLVPALWCFGH